MAMHRFFVDPAAMEGGIARLSEEDAAHALRVLRLKAGDEIRICDGCDQEYPAWIEEANKKTVTARMGAGYDLKAEPATRVTLYQGVPKAGKMEYLVQKGTEIGICRFVPFFSSRCVVKPGKDKGERYGRVAYEAAKQAHRGAVPQVELPVDFAGLCQALQGHELALAAWEEERALSVRAALSTAPGARDIALVVGPEGGLSAGETEELARAGAQVVTLGPRILRTETAGAVLAALVLYEKGDMQ